MKVNGAPITGATNTVDPEGESDQSLQYFVRPVLNGQELAASKAAKAWNTPYLEIPIQPIGDYRPGDASVGDLDGDGDHSRARRGT